MSKAKAFNPRTGQLWTLADPEIKRLVLRDRREMETNPEKALEFLREVGVVPKVTCGSGKPVDNPALPIPSA